MHRFYKVWYRYEGNSGWYRGTFLAYQDVGSLTVSESKNHVEFRGNKFHLQIPLSDINRISFGKQGKDTINGWVRVEYNEGKIAYFADGRFLGWHGHFGGTERIFETLIKAAGDRA